jgi:hypothetical protein
MVISSEAQKSCLRPVCQLVVLVFRCSEETIWPTIETILGDARREKTNPLGPP